ncbi:MAG: heavy metal translocating P-type ATPase [Chloroflexi bacterium]|nr:heavy metal translocating P-type ATPase [Chloroflexota bacterium]
MFRTRFWVSLVLTLPVLALSDFSQHLFGWSLLSLPAASWISALLGSVIFWWGGWPFLAGAGRELQTRQPGMMTLVALAISAAYSYSLALTFQLLEGMPFYWELATLVTVMLLGHWLEMRAVGSAESALNELAKLLPDLAERIGADGRPELVPVAALREGDLVLVRPGARVPADGIVEEGESQVDESMITGESRPVEKQPGSEVIAGTVNGSGSLRMRVRRIGEQTMLAGIQRLVREAQLSRSRAQDLAARAARWLTLLALTAALLTLLGWLRVRGLDDYTVERVVSVLVIACPHALGLAVPLVVAVTTTLAARQGILLRDRRALEEAWRVDTVVFDKTGTLTEGRQSLVGVVTVGTLSEDEALALAAAVEQDSEHPLARAVLAAAQERALTLPPAQEFQALPGRGTRAVVGGRTYHLGGPRLLEQLGGVLPPTLAAAAQQWGERGQTVIFLLEAETPLAALALADRIRPESRAAVALLRREGIQVMLLTGDSEEVARWVARELGITRFFASVLPEQKAAVVKQLQQEGRTVAMVGDGVNDAPALAQADVGIAIGAGTEVARAAAGIVLVRNDPRDVVRVLRLSRASFRKMVENLAWAAGYNLVALPLAAGVLAGVGLVLPAWVGALLMSLSTVIVALNAQALRALRLDLPLSSLPAPA